MGTGLSVGYETWQVSLLLWLSGRSINWREQHHSWILVSCNVLWAHKTDGNFHCLFKSHWQSLCTALMAGICLPLGLCKETVKESIWMSLTAEKQVRVQPQSLRLVQNGCHFADNIFIYIFRTENSCFWFKFHGWQAITWTNVDQDTWHHMLSLGYIELKVHTLPTCISSIFLIYSNKHDKAEVENKL